MKYIIPYIFSVVGCNLLFAMLPAQFAPLASSVAGAVFVARDFAHRRHPRAVLPAMAAAAVLSYLLASPAVAVASALAFAVSELVDYAVFRWAGGSFQRRVVLSSVIAVPLDTVLFLAGIGALSWSAALVMTCVKMVAALLVIGHRKS